MAVFYHQQLFTSIFFHQVAHRYFTGPLQHQHHVPCCSHTPGAAASGARSPADDRPATLLLSIFQPFILHADANCWCSQVSGSASTHCQSDRFATSQCCHRRLSYRTSGHPHDPVSPVRHILAVGTVAYQQAACWPPQARTSPDTKGFDWWHSDKHHFSSTFSLKKRMRCSEGRGERDFVSR